MKQMCKTCWCFLILSLIWQGLELLFYGEIQPRVVDDIMGVLFIPFVWKTFEK